MAVWHNCKMDTVSYRAADEDEPCEVKIDENVIVVSYFDDGGAVNYVGANDGTGHFKLDCKERDGQATLHMFEGGRFLEGYWIEGGYRGFWRIRLAD